MNVMSMRATTTTYIVCDFLRESKPSAVMRLEIDRVRRDPAVFDDEVISPGPRRLRDRDREYVSEIRA